MAVRVNHFRILGYVLTLVLHCGNLAAIASIKKKDFDPDTIKDLKLFQGMSYRYFTCWTVMLHLIYATVGLLCEFLTLRNIKKKKYKLNKHLSGFRNILFASLVWPTSWAVFTIFWPIFTYDRSLIFPEFLDQVISKTSNHIMHTSIVPIVIWESILRPRTRPKSDVRNLIHLVIHMLVYLAVFQYTYIENGVWLYPIFKVTYGTIHFVLLHIYVAILVIAFYYLQWVFNYVIHGSQDRIKKSN